MLKDSKITNIKIEDWHTGHVVEYACVPDAGPRQFPLSVVIILMVLRKWSENSRPCCPAEECAVQFTARKIARACVFRARKYVGISWSTNRSSRMLPLWAAIKQNRSEPMKRLK